MSTDNSTSSTDAARDFFSGGDSPPPPDTSSSKPSPPPPSQESPPPPVSSPPPPENTPSPPPPEKNPSPPPPEPTPPPPSPPQQQQQSSPPSTPSQPSPAANPPPQQTPQNLPAPATTEQPRSPDAQFFPPPTNDSPGSALAPPVEASPNSDFSPPSQLTPPLGTEAPPSKSSNDSVAVIVGISVAGGLILALIIACFLSSRRRKKRSYYYDNERPPNDWNTPHSMEHGVKIPPPPLNGVGNGQWGAPPVNFSGEYNYSGQHGQALTPQSPMGGLGFSSQSQFRYDDLAAATSGFSQANLLGQGGFGYVYKGVLPDGRVVAVKSLKSGSGQGEREFQAEVDIISRVHHRHLVSLVGYCIADGQRMLVYEFVSNSTMEHHLHGKGQPVMDWSSRVRIAIGSAKGLAYLHEDCHPRIIHRDIKAANILLDDNYEAMVADFGLAKLTTDNFTHVSTRVMGTFGYLAPEYAASGKLSEKSDVFSFGVMLLELITGRPPLDLTGQVMEDSLVDWARPLLAQALEDGDYSELADPNMEGNYEPHQMASMISCAAGSIRHSAKRRPKMSQIVRALEGETLLAEEASEPPKRARSNTGSSSTTSHDSTYDTVAYNNDMMKFKKMVLTEDDE